MSSNDFLAYVRERTSNPPPIKPPMLPRNDPPRPHHVVAWFNSGRLTKVQFPDRALAFDEYERIIRDEWPICYRVMIMDGRAEVARRDVTEPF